MRGLFIAVRGHPLPVLGGRVQSPREHAARAPAGEITTRYGPGPRQRAYSPPNYDARNKVVDQYYSPAVIENHRNQDGSAFI
jgi:hypothetical protein